MALHEINADLKTAEATLSHWEQTFPTIIRAEANAKVAFELAWSDALAEIGKRPLPEKGKAPTIPMNEAEATRMCAKELKAKREAEAEAEIAKKLIGIAETTLTSIQTRVKLDLIEAGLNGNRT